MMDLKKIAIMAIKEEAAKKPDEKVKIGRFIFTYREVAQHIGNNDDIKKLILEPYVRNLKRNKLFRMQVMKSLGLKG